MNKDTLYQYYDRVHDFYLKKAKLDEGKDFGNISDWCRYLDPSKHSQDKGLKQFVKDLIKRNILKRAGEHNGDTIYHPDYKGFQIAQYEMEKLIEDMGISKKFEVFRDKKKGTIDLEWDF